MRVALARRRDAARAAGFTLIELLVAMIIAVFKASLVVWYFMHVKYQSRLTKLTVATGLFFLAILLGLMLIDYGSKTGVRGVPVPLPPHVNSDSELGPAH